MTKPKTAINAFTPKSTAQIVGLSVHMLNYLARHGYLSPCYRPGGRGRVRHYSYRDLVVARIVKRLLDAGLEISKLKQGIQALANDTRWTRASPELTIRLLATDGTTLLLRENGTITDLLAGNQLTFAFILDVGEVQRDIKRQLSAEQLAHFSLRNNALKFG